MEVSCFYTLVLLVQFFILSIARLHSLTTDQSALMALKARINPETQNILANNWITATSVCNWIGITCDGQPQRVIALNLSSMGLKGTIPPDIGNLSSLALLSIENNSFYGQIPSSLFNCRQLKVLSLSSNNFTGVIPTELGNLTMLNKLFLSHNNLEGMTTITQTIFTITPNSVEIFSVSTSQCMSV